MGGSRMAPPEPRSTSSITFRHAVVHLKVVGDGQAAGGSESDEGVAVVAAAGESVGIQGGIEDAVGVEEKDVAGESAVRPAPAPQIAPSLPLGVTLMTVSWARVVAL